MINIQPYSNPRYFVILFIALLPLIKGDGAVLFSEEGLICNGAPDDDTQAACRKLGADLAAW